MTVNRRVARNLRNRGVVVLSRRKWGSKHRALYVWRRINKPARQPADTVVQHITVTDPTDGTFAQRVRLVEKIGYDRFGSGISYNWVVDMETGFVAVGMPLDAKGTHTVNDKGVAGYSHDQNLVARAIAVLGMPGTPLSKRAEKSIAAILAAMVEEGAITRGFDYDPHSKFAWKDCPCPNTRDRMPAIRRAALAAVKG